MTGNDILDNALALMFEERQRSPDYVSYAPRILNMLLPETFGVNNQLRRLAGKEPLAAPPVISTLEEEVAYEDDLVRSVLPWGLAAWLLMGDEEGRYPDYLSMYIQQANRATQLIPEQVEDVYADA
jgi:hypothetical protein|nr:MAG TPA: hypothetical protein [Caudoviricetes sp.]